MVKYNDQSLDRTFAALADPTRRALLARLGQRDGLSVSELARPFQMSLPAIMKHLDVLSDAGRDDVAFTIMNQRTYPSYGYWIAQGATTLWESWNGPAGVSRNHPALGSGVKWLYKGLAGLQIDPAKPGYEHVIIRPRMVGGVTQCSYHIKTQRGRFGVEWEKSESRVTIKVVIPVNSSATVYVPARSAVDVTESGTPVERTDGVEFLRMDDGCSVYDVGSGSYCFVAGA